MHSLCECQCAHCTHVSVPHSECQCAHSLQSIAGAPHLALSGVLSCVHPSSPTPPPTPRTHAFTYPRRFSFTSPTPCIIHEAWACFTHPPLEPSADRSRRRGEPLTLALKGVAVADGDSGGPGLVAAGQLSAQLEAKTRDAQVWVCVCVCVPARGGEVAGVVGQCSDGCFNACCHCLPQMCTAGSDSKH